MDSTKDTKKDSTTPASDAPVAPSRRGLLSGALALAGATLGLGLPTPAQASCEPPPTEVSPEGLEHARAFVRVTAEADTEPDGSDRDEFLAAGRDLLQLALESEGVAREFLVEIGEVTKRMFAEHALKSFYEAENPETRLFGADRAMSLALASLYARAARELADPEWGPVIRDALRSPGDYLSSARGVLAELEKDFHDGLLQATSERYREDSRYAAFIDQGFDELAGMETELRELGLIGDGREGSFLIIGGGGVTIVCSLTLPLCIALAIAIGIAIIAIVIVTSSSGRKR